MHKPPSTLPTSELTALLRLALPLVAVNVGTQLMGVVDTALSGRIGALAQGATGLGTTVFFFGAILGMGVVMGIDPLTSQAFGAGRPRDARAILRQSLWVCMVAAVPITAAIYFGTQWLTLLGISSELATETGRYVFTRLPSVLPFLLVSALRSYLQSASRVAVLLAAAALSNGLNLAINWLLIFGDDGLLQLGLPALGIPAMGVAGLGLATTLATVANVAMLAWVVRNDRAGAQEPQPQVSWFQVYAPDRQRIAQILTLGLPIGMHLLAEIGIFTAAGLLAGRMGETAMAAHQVALQLAALAFMVPMGVAAATSVRVGRAIGAGDSATARRAGFAGIGAGAAFMGCSALMMWSAPLWFAGVMTADPAVLELATELIVIAAAFQLFDGIQVVSAGALRGAGLTRWTMAANLIAYWGIAFPLLLGLGVGLGYGVHGIWWGLTVGLMTAAVLLCAKFNAASLVK